MAKFKMTPLIPVDAVVTARLGLGSGSANYYTDKEVGKAVKLNGDSRYVLCAAGDQIEGFIVAMETASLDDYSIGSVIAEGRKNVVCDGFQANPGVANSIVVGDYVVMGSVIAKDTALTVNNKVCKATTQTGMYFAWRVVSLGNAGAVGDTAVIERVNA